MPHVLSLYDSDFLHWYDLTKDEVTVEIESVEAATLTGQGGRKSKKPLLKFKGATKAFAICKTDAKTISGLYGSEVNEWAGKKITIYKAQTLLAGETVSCLRCKAPVGKPDA